MSTPPPRTATAEQAHLLLDVRLRPLLSALMAANGKGGGGKSVGELTDQLGGAEAGWPLRRIHYQVRRLAAAGIVEQVGLDRRAGRPVRRYAMPQPWFIPFEVTQAITLEGFLAAQILPRTEQMVGWQAAVLLAEQPRWGFWLRPENLHLGSQGGPPVRQLLENQPFLSTLGSSQLRPERALEFKRRLWALVSEFQDDDDAGENYALSVQFVCGQVE